MLFIVYIVLFNVGRGCTRVRIPEDENYWGSPYYLRRLEKKRPARQVQLLVKDK